MAEVIDGNAVAAQVRERVAAAVSDFVAAGGSQPGLATVLVGDDPASKIYVRRKGEDARAVGMASFHHDLPADAEQREVEALLTELNRDDSVNGILLQLPVPPQIDGNAMIETIDPLKDVDGLTAHNAGLLMHGRPGMVPCTPAGCMELLRHAGTELRGAEAVVVGRSLLVGKPMAALLLAADATVTHCHSRTRDLAAQCARADVLVAAVGRPHLITGAMVKEGATVLDVGMNRTGEGLAGDVDFESVEEKARAITPVPGGVGPMTRAMLLENTLTAARAQVAD
jgi:methylenetetrahydrofolate dehydrogenase (NADP+) / methenyltetrahydrofolate cyclohydrolase